MLVLLVFLPVLLLPQLGSSIGAEDKEAEGSYKEDAYGDEDDDADIDERVAEYGDDDVGAEYGDEDADVAVTEGGV